MEFINDTGTGEPNISNLLPAWQTLGELKQLVKSEGKQKPYRILYNNYIAFKVCLT
jgi:hypothetical protein